MPELSTVARVKEALRIPAAVTTHDVRIGQILDEVEGSARAELGLSSWVASYETETPRTTPGRSIVLLDRFPVWAVASATLSSSPLVENQDFEWDSDGRFELLDDGRFPTSARQLSVHYLAGPIQVAGSTPADLIRLATLMAARQWTLEPIAGLAAGSIRPIAKTVATDGEDAIEALINQILAKYRKPLG